MSLDRSNITLSRTTTSVALLFPALVLAAAIACGGSSSPTAPTENPPPGATAAMVAEGRNIFNNGTCQTCHGRNGTGGNLGPDLTDRVYLHNSGNWEELIEIIRTGVPASEFKSPNSLPEFFMQPSGAMALSDAQIRAVAAYVWSLSH